jgi:hypothetical protein
MGRDHTLFSMIDGFVRFENKTKDRKRISVYAGSPIGVAESSETQTAQVAQ